MWHHIIGIQNGHVSYNKPYLLTYLDATSQHPKRLKLDYLDLIYYIVLY
jgi:hypothetical protein